MNKISNLPYKNGDLEYGYIYLLESHIMLSPYDKNHSIVSDEDGYIIYHNMDGRETMLRLDLKNGTIIAKKTEQ